MSDTMSNLIQDTITRLSMVAGVSVQVYSENRIAMMIQHKFEIVRDMLWWDDMMVWQELTQGADGRPVENVVRALPDVPVGTEIVINQYKDIQYAWDNTHSNPLKSLPKRLNPRAVMREGKTLYRVPDEASVIRFLPFYSGKQMMVRYKKHYGVFGPADIVPMDRELLIAGACYDYLEDDGTNPGQTDKFRNFYNDRLTQLVKQENDEEIAIGPQPWINTDGKYQVVT